MWRMFILTCLLSCDLAATFPAFRYEQILHLCQIVFTKSEYYCHPRQMVVLLAEISNSFIMMINQHIDYTSVP